MTVFFVIAVIVIFLSIDWFAQPKKLRAKLATSQAGAGIALPVRTPAGVFFAKSHTWLNVFPSGKLRIGVDDFVGNMIKNPEVAFLKDPGDSVKKGEPLLTLSEAGHTLTVRSPLEGRVISANHALIERPELMRESLFSEGWAYTIEPKKFSEVKRFMLGEEAQAWIPSEFRRLRDVLAGIGGTGSLVPATLQDGGTPIEGALAHCGADAWKRFDEEFMQVS
jgi:glycine cleavage system H lipoate-binding protein